MPMTLTMVTVDMRALGLQGKRWRDELLRIHQRECIECILTGNLVQGGFRSNNEAIFPEQTIVSHETIG